jgi:RHS repeat-associated protein
MRITQATTTSGGTTTPGYYTYNSHNDVEAVTGASGTTTATYGYTAYGNPITSQTTGADKNNTTPGSTTTPYNSYRFNAMRWDSSTGQYDMGFRTYSPGLNQFLSRDMYNGALADMNLATDPFTGSPYAFANGNPITNIELDGHMLVADGGGSVTSSSSSAQSTGCPIIALTCGPICSPQRLPPAAAAAAAAASVWGPDCNPFTFKLGACPSERGAAGTTPQQVKQSFIGALWVLTSVIPVGDLLDAALGARAAAGSGSWLNRLGSWLGRRLAPKTTAYAHAAEPSDAAYQGALHVQGEFESGNLNHGIPGVDMTDTNAVARYLDNVMQSPGYSVQGGKTAWYDPSAQMTIIQRTSYSATTYQMSPARWINWLQANIDPQP